MVVFNSDFIGVAVFKTKADTPLLVDSYGEFSRTLSFKPLKMICRRTTKIIFAFSRANQKKFLQRTRLNLRR